MTLFYTGTISEFGFQKQKQIVILKGNYHLSVKCSPLLTSSLIWEVTVKVSVFASSEDGGGQLLLHNNTTRDIRKKEEWEWETNYVLKMSLYGCHKE